MAITPLSLVPSLIKPGLKTALIEALYNEIVTNATNYYYFLGKTLEWDSVNDTVLIPGSDLAYEAQIREEMIFLKKITSADVAFTIPRHDWNYGEVFDMYDDFLGRKLTYNCAAPAGSTTLTGTFNPADIGVGWYVTGTIIPDNLFSIDTQVVDVTNTTVTISKPTLAPVSRVMFTNVTYSTAESLSDAKFYCMTSDRHVYKCLDNNRNSPSTVRPFSTTHEPIRTSDGYIWKYMYTIPTSFANKFTTRSDIPVIRGLNSQYYSRGALTSITILDYGQDYTSDDTLTVVGNGTLAENPFRIIAPIITSPGAGYTTAPTITIDAPYVSSEFVPNATLFAGEHVRVSNRVYEVVQSGITGPSAPIHTSSTAVTNGTTSMRFVGIQATANATLLDGSVDDVVLTGVIGYVNIDQAGQGYDPLNPPAVTIAGDGIGATAVASVSSEGYLTAITLVTRGSGYSTASVTIDPPPTRILTFNGSSGSIVSLANDTLTISGHELATGTQVIYQNGGGTSIGGLQHLSTYYVMAVTPTTIKLATSYVDAVNGVSAIDLTSLGTGTSHTISLSTVPSTATAEIYYGYGYSTQPNVTVSPPFVEDIIWTPEGIVDYDDIVKADSKFYRVTSLGTNQILGTETPLHGAGSATNGQATLLFIGEVAAITLFLEKTNASVAPVIRDGQIVNVIIQDPGTGYTVADVVALGAGTGALFQPNLSIGDANSRQASTELLAVPGTINAIAVMNGGAGYAWATVTVTGDGEGCTADAVIESGRIVKIVVTNPGFGYTKATVEITGNPESTQAYARAICSPVEGHGSNAVSELFARDLCVSTTIARDRNNGFVVENDYRQLGILKNPQSYSSSRRFTDLSGSTCWSITGDFIYEDVQNDMIMVDGDGNRYRVIAKPLDVPSTSVMPLLLQSVDNSVPVVGQTLSYTYNNTTNQAVITIVSSPTVNKYSGDMLFIDNRSSFQPTDEQTISIKTVIRL